MTQVMPSIPEASRYGQVCSGEQIAAFTTAEIREAIAHWVAQDRLDIADALAAAGMSLHPGSQDLLAVGALLAEIRQDWTVAQDCLEQLMEAQGADAPAETWFHLVRVMRCRAAYFSAWRKAQEGLALHPAHEGLQHEFEELSLLLSEEPAPTHLEAHAD